MSRGPFLTEPEKLPMRTKSRTQRTKPAAQRLRFQPRVQALEDRTLLSTAAGALPVLQPAPFGSEAALKEYLIDLAVQQYSSYFGQPYYFWGWGYPWRYAANTLVPSGAPVTLTATSTGSSADSNTFSTTNSQVQGVDEGDTVKTDGQYLYLLSGDQVLILQAWPASQMQIVSATTLPGNALVEYLYGNRLTVISQEYQPVDLAPVGIGMMRPIFWGTNPVVDVSVYDVSDRGAPQLVQDTTLDGSYDASRAIGATVYVATNKYLNLPMPEFTSGWDSFTYESEDSYRARLEALPLDGLLPHYTTTWTDVEGTHNQTGLITAAGDVYQQGLSGALNLMSVVSFDVGGSVMGPTHSTSFLSDWGDTMYAAPDNFYLISTQWSDQGGSTLIDKISLQDGNIRFTAAGEVPGTILNQFSVGENGAYLDIATTTGWGSDASNNVYVLGENNGTLTVVGSLEGLAPGEQIYSVWFMGDRGFVSTFEHVDPLFALDLSDPTAPRVAGQLEVSGYTGYLQALDATHLLGIGRDVDPTTNEPSDIIISLFDVSDLAHPQLVSSYRIAPQGWAWSDALYDYHAITYYPAYQELTLPVSSNQVVTDPGTGDELWTSQTDLLVFHLDLTQGNLKLQGTVSDTSPIERSVFINQVLYTVSYTSVQAYSLDDLTTPVAQVALPTPQYAPYGGWWIRPIVWGLPVRVLPIVLPGVNLPQVPVESGSTGSHPQPGTPTGSMDPTTGQDTPVSPLAPPVLPVTTPVLSAGGSVSTGVSEPAPVTPLPVSPAPQAPTPSPTSGGGGQEADGAAPLDHDGAGDLSRPGIENEQELGSLPFLQGPATEWAGGELSPQWVDAVFSDVQPEETPRWGWMAALVFAAGTLRTSQREVEKSDELDAARTSELE
jgi:uncharacterized secreted protein with C-terminal beta-propeller domain